MSVNTHHTWSNLLLRNCGQQVQKAWQQGTLSALSSMLSTACELFASVCRSSSKRSSLIQATTSLAEQVAQHYRWLTAALTKPKQQAMVSLQTCAKHTKKHQLLRAF